MAPGDEVQAAALLVRIVEHHVDGDVPRRTRALPVGIVLVPGHDPGMVGRLVEDLVVPEAQALHLQELSEGLGQARVEDEGTQGLVHEPAAEEVTDNLVGALAVGRLDLVELRLEHLEPCPQVIHAGAQVSHLVLRQEVDAHEETVAAVALHALGVEWSHSLSPGAPSRPATPAPRSPRGAPRPGAAADPRAGCGPSSACPGPSPRGGGSAGQRSLPSAR